MALAEVNDGLPEWSLGERLTKARKDAGLDQAEMGALVGKSKAAISAWESNVSAPKPKEFYGIVQTYAEASGLDPAWIAGFRTGSFLTLLPDVPQPELPFPVARELAAVPS